jgi:hypothetical protein
LSPRPRKIVHAAAASGVEVPHEFSSSQRFPSPLLELYGNCSRPI